MTSIVHWTALSDLSFSNKDSFDNLLFHSRFMAWIDFLQVLSGGSENSIQKSLTYILCELFVRRFVIVRQESPPVAENFCDGAVNENSGSDCVKVEFDKTKVSLTDSQGLDISRERERDGVCKILRRHSLVVVPNKKSCK